MKADPAAMRLQRLFSVRWGGGQPALGSGHPRGILSGQLFFHLRRPSEGGLGGALELLVLRPLLSKVLRHSELQAKRDGVCESESERERERERE